MRLVAHLEAGAPCPGEYLELFLCRDVYHCPPQMLPPLSKILPHLTCIAEENRHRERERKRKTRTGKSDNG